MDVSMKSVVKGAAAFGIAGAVAALSGCVLDPTYGSGYPGNGYPGRPSGPNYPQRPGYSNGQTFRCESNDNRQQYCRADTRGGVQLTRQLSDSACVQGRSWGYDSNGIWVSNGCRAEFRTGYGNGNGNGNGGYYPGGGNGQTMRCESNDNRRQYCRADTRGGVQLTRQLSSTQCVQGRNWGYDSNGIWVSDGCRAEFRTGYGGGNGGSGQTVRCESDNGRYRTCAANVRQGVRLVRQLSDTQCVQGRNWGWNGNSIWVNGGCRADFSVY